MSWKYHSIVVGHFEVNCYLFWDEASSAGIIIDPGADSESIIKAISELGIEPLAVFLTHAHVDHIGALSAIRERYEIPLYVGKNEVGMLSDSSANCSAFLDSPIIIAPAEHILDDEQIVTAGPVKLKVLNTPGHTKGGLCLLSEEAGILFCGDTLFAGSIGRTDLPGGSFTQIIDSIREKILTLPDSVVCLPGHGPSTTVEAERRSNPFLIGGSFV